MLSTIQIIQIVLVAVIYLAAIALLLSSRKTEKRIVLKPILPFAAFFLFLVFMIIEAVFSIYYLKFIMGYGVNAGLLSAAAVVLLFMPFTGYTSKAIAVIRSIPFKITQPERIAKGTRKQIEKPQTILKEDKTQELIVETIEVSGEQIAAVMEDEEKDNSTREKVQVLETDFVPVNPTIIEPAQTDISDATSKTDNSAAGTSPLKKKPGQKSASKKQQGSQPLQKTTGGKTRGRKKK